jgi:hypothetical protein
MLQNVSERTDPEEQDSAFPFGNFDADFIRISILCSLDYADVYSNLSRRWILVGLEHDWKRFMVSSMQEVFKLTTPQTLIANPVILSSSSGCDYTQSRETERSLH